MMELHDQGIKHGTRRIAQALITQGFKAIGPKSFKPRTTESRHRLGYSPNLLLDAKEPTRINQQWVGDITYLPLAEGGYSYLAMLMDRHSRAIVGWSLADDMPEQLVMRELRDAIAVRQPPSSLIHHTDRGGQYASKLYRAMLARAGIKQSMSRPDNGYDNAFMESCFGTIKTELEITEYQSQETAHQQLAEYVTYYNRERKHSSLDYQSPAQFESR
jgi:transposase InsO family protein